MPIRAPYGWQYWYCPKNFSKVLMQTAFVGYLEDIAADEDEDLAWAFASATDYQELLITKWGGTRGQETVDMNDIAIDHVAESESVMRTKSPTQEESSMGTLNTEAQKRSQSTSLEFRKRSREEAGLPDVTDRPHKLKRHLLDGAATKTDGLLVTEQDRVRNGTAHYDSAVQEEQERTSPRPDVGTSLGESKKRKREIGDQDQSDTIEDREPRKRRLQDEVVRLQEGAANAGHSQSSSLAYACDLLTDCTLPVIP